jgi:GAF domain-containing protein
VSDTESLSLDEGLQQLSRLVLRDETLETTLQRIVDVAGQAIPGVLGVSITLQKKGRDPYTAVATSAQVQAIDEREYALREGPCVTAMDTGQLQRIDDVDHEVRWPKFTEVCREEGLGSVLGVPLHVAGVTYGAMNLYAVAPGAFDGAATAAAELLTEQAGVALANTRTYAEATEKIVQLQEALDSRVVIEQAKGILMATERIDADAAFGRLKDRSQRTNRKLRVVAEEVIRALAAPT